MDGVREELVSVRVEDVLLRGAGREGDWDRWVWTSLTRLRNEMDRKPK